MSSYTMEPLTGIAAAIRLLYGVANKMNDFIDEHIDSMQQSSNITISRTGQVLAGAKYGFGIGYVIPVAVIAIGQLILGNTFAAISTVTTAAAFSNPVAMTCAAIGALYYGWGALSEQERNDILERVCNDLKIGVELVKAVVAFVIAKTKDLLSVENFKDIKNFITVAATSFGKTLGDVTGAIRDHLTDTYAAVKDTAEVARGTVMQKIKKKQE